MRVAIMGAREGHMTGMLRSALRANNVNLVGIVEPDDDCYERTVQHQAIRRFATLEDMIDQARPELIMEGLNHRDKTALVEKAAAAGIHLLLDKPLCHSFDDWHRMKEAVHESGIHVSMWFTSRSFPPFVRLREHILAGDLGELVSFVSTHPHKITARTPQWKFDPSMYTGVFHDLACHGVDQIRWLSGSEFTGVHAVASRMRNHPGSLDDHVQASFTLANGAGAVVTADWLTPEPSPSFGDTRFIIMGTRGSAHLKAYARNHLLIVSDTLGTIEPSFDDVPRGSFVQDLVEAITTGQRPLIPTEDVFAVAKACLLAERSARENGAFLPMTG